MKPFNTRYLEFCLPFVDGVKNIFETMLDVELKSNKPIMKVESSKDSFYSAIMGINGTYHVGGVEVVFQGSMVISWPLSSYLKLSSKMLMEKYNKYNEEIKDVGMEIANITTGGAKAIISELGYKVDMSIPNCIVGEDHAVESKKNTTTIIIPFDSELGKFTMELNYFELLD